MSASGALEAGLRRPDGTRLSVPPDSKDTIPSSCASTADESHPYYESDGMSDGGNTTGRRATKNIRLMMVLVFFLSLGNSVAFGPVFDKYLYQLSGGKNTIVGLVESVNGLASLISAVPIAWSVDKLSSRSRVAQSSAIVGIVSTVFFILSIVDDTMAALICTLVVMGIWYELQNSATEAMFADSCPQGERSQLFVRKSMIAMVGSATGPLLSATGILWLNFKDQWPTESVHMVLVAGALCYVPCLGIATCFEDPPCHKTQEERTGAALISQSKYQKWVPYIIATCDFITSIGAGMTVKFFNLFFINEEKFTALEICLLQTAYPLGIALFQYILQRASTKVGRAQASFFAFVSNVICFLILWKAEDTTLLVTVFLIRGGFANGVYPIDRSILMDYTPSTQRGRWNAVESFSTVTWSGSAILGGYLVDQHDYRAPCLATALFYAVGALVYIPLLFLVPRDEKARVVGLQPLVVREDQEE